MIDNGCVIHRAGWIVVDPWTILHNGFVQVDAGLITNIGKWKGHCSSNVIDHGSGALFPALVNAHTHLELCALRGKVPYENGFRFWVEKLLEKREAAGEKVLCIHAKNGIKESIKYGCKVMGEVSTLGLTQDMFSRSGLSGIWFREFLGDTFPAEFSCRKKKNREATISLAAHAPHTLSPKFLIKLKNITRKNNMPLSIHLAESEDEIEFLATGKGRWAEFLSERGIDFSDWGLPVNTPVQYLESLGILDEKTIAVHLIHVKGKDIDLLKSKNIFVCLCLRSNYNLHKRLPDLAGILRAGIKPCIGTDSLASVESLNMFDEMAFVSRSFPFVSPAGILAMATINGAAALGVEDRFGSLFPGKCGVFTYVPADILRQTEICEAIINSQSRNFL